STSHYYLLFAHETLASCIPVYPWCCLFTLDRIYGGETDLSEVFMLELACYGAPPRPLHNLAAGDRARPTRCRQLRQGFRGIRDRSFRSSIRKTISCTRWHVTEAARSGTIYCALRDANPWSWVL
ncbi:hypothetical protein FOC1_g10001118, partial [Fusarium oxysporum f. sp. cubense race 1]